MKSILVISILAISSVTWSQSDSTQTAAVRAVIDQFFDGMRSGDSTLVRASFYANPRLLTSYQVGGDFRLYEGSFNEFVTAIGTPHEEIWDERISNVVIHIDAGLAQVWMDYSFYLGDQFSHSGTNAMQLVNLHGNWQIVHVIDTHKKGD